MGVPLTNSRHEQFAVLMAQGTLTQDEAYQQAGYAPSRPNAARLTTNEHIQSRIEELRTHITTKAVDEAGFTLAEAIKFLADVVRTPIGRVDEMSPLVQEYSIEPTPNGERRKCKMVSKCDALDKLARIFRWYDDEAMKKPVEESFESIEDKAKRSPMLREALLQVSVRIREIAAH